MIRADKFPTRFKAGSTPLTYLDAMLENAMMDPDAPKQSDLIVGEKEAWLRIRLFVANDDPIESAISESDECALDLGQVYFKFSPYDGKCAGAGDGLGHEIDWERSGLMPAEVLVAIKEIRS